eukprot:COSAG01_NODE_242_length_20582_cov_314.397256_22_plen_55_part_00
MNALNQAVLRSQTEISLHAVTANRIVLAGPPRPTSTIHVYSYSCTSRGNVPHSF